ncbi:MAG: CHAT domain-containing protein [bacterium]|nr:CHAT domain-containing protein [bacterium]
MMGNILNKEAIDESQRQSDRYWAQAEKLVEEGCYLEAALFYKKSAAAEKTGRQPRLEKVVEILNVAGYCYYQLCQYSEALKLYERALDLARNLGWDFGTAPVLRNLGRIYEAWGQYANALDYFEQALALHRQSGHDADIARDLNNIGRVYKAWGQYANALDYYEQSLGLNRQLEQDSDTAAVLRNIGVVHHLWGQYANALEYYEQALAIAKHLGKKAEIAIILNSVGRAYHSWGRYVNALDHFQQALTIAQQLGRDAHIARSLNNIGLVYHSRGQCERALAYYEQALALNRQLGRSTAILGDLYHIGRVYESCKGYAKALEYFQQALTLARQFGRDADIAQNLDSLGEVYYALQQYPEAIRYLEEAVEIKEQLRKTAKGDVRRDYLASQIYSYEFLTSCYVRTDELAQAFETIELSRARRLAEQLAGSDAAVEIPSLAHIRETLSENMAILIYANIDLPDIVELLITKEQLLIVELSKNSFVQEAIDLYQQEIEKTVTDDGKKKRSRSVKKDKEGFPVISEEDAHDFEKIIEFYRQLLTNSNGAEPVGNLGKQLYNFLIGHVQEHLAGKTDLLIVPDGMLNFLPFETLVHAQDKYLVESYTISYAQSLAVLELIEQRSYGQERNPLLAFGGAVYNPRTYQAEHIENDAQLSYLQNRANRAMSRNLSLQEMYSTLGYGSWKNLPGTLREVKTIERVVNGADVITGSAVSKTTIEELSSDGILAKYKVLHFATHGVAVPEIPELSALVLSQKPPGDDDGYLYISEIAELTLRADFVNLSACETGLGKVYSGEGVVGLTQAFLLAGANRLSVSLWQVADDSTTDFMVALYKLVVEEELSYSAAIAEVRRRFIRGEFGEQWQAPRYWAPFVYYGKD